jgi:hypothetical protein
MVSPYLTNKTAALESQTPVDPSQARAAQIPLQNFNLPTFPSSAFSAGLTSLILTSDIKLDDYADLLTQPFSVPDLPKSIKSLTLELFSLGYPPGFLSELGRQLEGLKAVTLYSQLFAGTTNESRNDAIEFIKEQTELKELHLLDVFGPSGVFTDLMVALSPELKFLEINYTFRHSDPKFLASIPAGEIVASLKKGLVALTLSISGPDITKDEEDREGTEMGMRPVAVEGKALVERLREKVGAGLVMADLTMFELSVKEVETVLDFCKGVRIWGVSVGLENGWGEVLNIVGKEDRGVNIEGLEIVGVPGEELVERLKGSGELVVEKGELDALGERCKKLKSLKVSILRTKMEHWAKDEEEWVKKT